MIIKISYAYDIPHLFGTLGHQHLQRSVNSSWSQSSRWAPREEFWVSMGSTKLKEPRRTLPTAMLTAAKNCHQYLV